MLVGTVEVALVAMVVSFPLALMFALFISDYAPQADQVLARLGGRPHGRGAEHHLRPLGVLPPAAARHQPGPLAQPVPRLDPHLPRRHRPQRRRLAAVALHELGVHRRSGGLHDGDPAGLRRDAGRLRPGPVGEREAAMALGGTRFGVARTVVLPFAKGGIIGGTMLALGRALGETAAVLIIISPEYVIKDRGSSRPARRRSRRSSPANFGNATKSQLSALLTAGFVLFVITLVVNSVAAVVIRRSRSGAEHGDLTMTTLEAPPRVNERSEPTPSRRRRRRRGHGRPRRVRAPHRRRLALAGRLRAGVLRPGDDRLPAPPRLQRDARLPVCWYLVFLLVYAPWCCRSPTPVHIVVERLVTATLYLAAAVVIFALGTTVVYTFAQGLAGPRPPQLLHPRHVGRGSDGTAQPGRHPPRHRRARSSRWASPSRSRCRSASAPPST